MTTKPSLFDTIAGILDGMASHLRQYDHRLVAIEDRLAKLDGGADSARAIAAARTKAAAEEKAAR